MDRFFNKLLNVPAKLIDLFMTLFQLPLKRIDALSDFRLNGAHALKAGFS